MRGPNHDDTLVMHLWLTEEAGFAFVRESEDGRPSEYKHAALDLSVALDVVRLASEKPGKMQELRNQLGEAVMRARRRLTGQPAL